MAREHIDITNQHWVDKVDFCKEVDKVIDLLVEYGTSSNNEDIITVTEFSRILWFLCWLKEMVS